MQCKPSCTAHWHPGCTWATGKARQGHGSTHDCPVVRIRCGEAKAPHTHQGAPAAIYHVHCLQPRGCHLAERLVLFKPAAAGVGVKDAPWQAATRLCWCLLRAYTVMQWHTLSCSGIPGHSCLCHAGPYHSCHAMLAMPRPTMPHSKPMQCCGQCPNMPTPTHEPYAQRTSTGRGRRAAASPHPAGTGSIAQLT